MVNELNFPDRIESLLDSVSSHLEMSYDVAREPDDGADLVLSVNPDGHNPVRFLVELCAEPRLARVLQAAEQVARFAAEAGGYPVVAVPRLGAKLRQALRERAVGYLSLDGQVHLRGGGIFIDRPRDPNAKVPAEHSAANLFADKSSRLLRYLLRPADLSPSVRDLAAELGISPGLISRLVAQLRDEGYLMGDGDRLVGQEALLEDWAEFYRRRARRQEQRRYYLHARGVENVMDRLRELDDSALPPWALSFQAGASLVAPFAFFSEAHVLLGGVAWERSADAFAEHLGLEPARREANLILVRPYYRQSWDFNLQRIDGLPVVSDVQLFLDLQVYPRRGEAQGERIRERILDRQRGSDK